MSFELIVLGSSSALPTSKRFTSAHLLNINERFFLIDCGEGTQIQLRKNKLSPAKINHIFISHLHGDHVFGLFGLISSLGMMGRKAPLHIYGPSGLEDLLQSHFKFFIRPEYSIKVIEAKHNALVYSDSIVDVRSISLNHRGPTFAYYFKERSKQLNLKKEALEKYQLGVEQIKNIKEGKDLILDDTSIVKNSELTLPPYSRRSYAYISDTAYLPELADYIQDVDLLYHEATFLERDKKLAHSTMHSTAMEAAKIANLVNAGKLLIGHFSTRYKNELFFEEEARQIFKESYVVNDGDTFDVKQCRKEE